MSLLNCTFNSQVLGSPAMVNVILPNSIKENPDKKYPVLYLYHGMGGNQDNWLRFTAIERYAEEYNIIIVIPCVLRGFYTNMEYGPNYYDYIAYELVDIINSHFPTSQKCEETFTAGLSMGGYGALKIALSRPDVFSACASLSGAVDFNKFKDDESVKGIFFPNEREAIFGNMNNPKDDLFNLISDLKDKKHPKIYFWCGTEDFLYESNQNLKKVLDDNNYEYVYEESIGNHQWKCWDAKIKTVLEWLNSFCEAM